MEPLQFQRPETHMTIVKAGGVLLLTLDLSPLLLPRQVLVHPEVGLPYYFLTFGKGGRPLPL